MIMEKWLNGSANPGTMVLTSTSKRTATAGWKARATWVKASMSVCPNHRFLHSDCYLFRLHKPFSDTPRASHYSLQVFHRLGIRCHALVLILPYQSQVHLKARDVWCVCRGTLHVYRHLHRSIMCMYITIRVYVYIYITILYYIILYYIILYHIIS